MSMNDDTSAAFEAFDNRLASDAAADAPWEALQDLARAVIGAKLFTIMTVDMPAGLARREYTSDPVAYPVSGTKPVHYDEWFDLIANQRRPFIANTIADIAKVFPDHQTIWSLGCGSVINIPVFVGGKLLGTVNCLDVEYHYTPERVEKSGLLGIPAKLAFLAAAARTTAPG
jgi:hypothetical protein